MRLYIIRHGETPWNTELRLQGQTDIALNENGRLLAKQTACALQNVPFDAAFTSPLIRAVETAEIILNGRNIPLIREERIREIGFGEMEGRRMTKEEREDPASEFYAFFHAPEKYRPPKGGETIDELFARTGDFLDELRNRKEWREKTILVSSHGAAVRSLLANISRCDRRDFWAGRVPPNCSVSIAELLDGNWIIKEQDRVYYENI